LAERERQLQPGSLSIDRLTSAPGGAADAAKPADLEMNDIAFSGDCLATDRSAARASFALAGTRVRLSRLIARQIAT